MPKSSFNSSSANSNRAYAPISSNIPFFHLSDTFSRIRSDILFRLYYFSFSFPNRRCVDSILNQGGCILRCSVGGYTNPLQQSHHLCLRVRHVGGRTGEKQNEFCERSNAHLGDDGDHLCINFEWCCYFHKSSR